LTAFLWFNKYPARVFPGDTLMFFMGATLAAAGMLSSLYIQTFLIFLPMIAEFLLKLRGLFEGENYCTRTSDGHLEYSGRTESLTHVLMKNLKLTERQLVAAIWAIEGMICGVVLAVDFAI
jgi:UDP-N-acetylglucosamine--dolichyl-phosphate N-acetylglucosaminephosphotransferase